MYFFFMDPEHVTNYGLKRLDNDNNTIEISLFVDKLRVMHVYYRDDVDLNLEVDEEIE